MLSYVLSLVPAALALLQLAKDWGAHQTHWRRASVLVLIVVLGAGGAINTYRSAIKTEAQRNADQRRISGLEEAVKTANANQEANTKQFVKSFGQLADKVGNLESQVKTANLQKEAAQLKRELEATQKAMSPPKAEIRASLGVITEKLENVDVKQLSVPALSDGSVEFPIQVVNVSRTQAKTGAIFLRICNLCEFKEEPALFEKVAGTSNADRVRHFEMLGANVQITVPLKVKPPSDAGEFEVGVVVRCENCVVREKDVLVITVTRDGR